MAKFAIVDSSKLSGCLLPNRHVGECHKCNQVMKCEQPEALQGKLIILRERMNKQRDELLKTTEEINKILSKLE